MILKTFIHKKAEVNKRQKTLIKRYFEKNM